MRTISRSVGIRNGMTIMPNNPADVQTIAGLLDQIPLENGGTASTPGLWSSDQTLLIGQVTAAIIAFQTVNNRHTIDGVIDPGGGTLLLMNQLVPPEPITAMVVQEDVNSQSWIVAEPSSLPGTGPLIPLDISPQLTRKLISVNGSSIKWFGVVIPLNDTGQIIDGAQPHLFFTPSPNQGGYDDSTYDEFTAWTNLWDDYTSVIGSQLVASGAPQILVIPFYKTAQSGKLGSFLTDWREVISVVVTAAMNSIDPLFLSDRFAFDRIFSSSFSNGVATLQNFHTQGADVASLTQMTFDLDGQASRPNPGLSYRNTPAPSGMNPQGGDWHVGGRFAQLRPSHAGSIDHNICPYLLLHGLTMFGQ
jgi:hypothetical protein